MKDPDYFTRLRMVLLGDGKQKRIRTRMVICHERRVSIPAFFFVKKLRGLLRPAAVPHLPRSPLRKK